MKIACRFEDAVNGTLIAQQRLNQMTVLGTRIQNESRRWVLGRGSISTLLRAFAMSMN